MLKTLIAAVIGFVFACNGSAERPPNIVWIVGEDMGPELGCYGDKYAVTPNMDGFSRQSARFTRAFTHAPVCAPSRSGLITGRYPTSIGTHHMRSELLQPPKLFTAFLREAGYHVLWPGKTDFNFKVPPGSFDSTKDWLKQFPTNRPFFAYINFTTSHESQIRAAAAKFASNTIRLTKEQRRDPSKAPLPPYHPDTPEVRKDLARYYELVTAVDYQVGEVLKKLEEQGVAQDTVVFLFGDHGRGLPRSKRWIYDSGIHVPLLVRWPGKIKPASVRNDLVTFVDFAPTVLSIAGMEIPKEFQGQPFLGPNSAADRKYIFAARDRMDEAYDRIRAVRDTRYKYIRNVHPELPYSQRIDYMEQMPTMRVWREMNAAGKLNDAQKLFFAPAKPEEELYDLEKDPHEIKNLAADPRQRKKLLELRRELDRWMAETGDMGAIPETDLIQRGLVTDKLQEYQKRIKPLPTELQRN